MKLSIKELLETSKGKLLSGETLTECFDISTDTRKINSSNIFLPLKGEFFDGHNFINDAVDNGCKAYFTEKGYDIDKQADFIILVENTLDAYLNAARYIRRKINPTVIAITGSSGKTSTKEFIYSVLSTSFNTHKSYLNHNNEIGLCQTLLSMPESAKYLVIEMGMRGMGEIELLSKYSEPDIAVITNIGTAHIGRMGSIENIAEAKGEITRYLKNSGVFVAFDDDSIKKYCNWDGKKIFYGKDFEITQQEENLTGFSYKNEHFEIPIMGEYNVINALAAIEIGKLAGISYENIKKGLLNYTSVGDRGKIITLNNGAKIVVDCYNANPDSVKVSVNSVIKAYNGSKITLVLGDMAELGEHEEKFHREVGTFISGLAVNSLVTVGEKAKLIAQSAKNKNLHVKSFMNNTDAAEYLQNNMEKGSVLFFKASRCMKLEEIAEKLQAL